MALKLVGELTQKGKRPRNRHGFLIIPNNLMYDRPHCGLCLVACIYRTYVELMRRFAPLHIMMRSVDSAVGHVTRADSTMDDDVNIVDDNEGTSQPAPGTSHTPSNAGINPESFYASAAPPRPTRTSGQPSNSPRLGATRTAESSDRTTRSASTKVKPQPKLKLKLSEKAAAQAPGMSFLGAYDRELDSDDEDLAFEEQFVLRMPPGEDCEKLRKMVVAREIPHDVWFKFKGVSPGQCSQLR
jgi:hypothetical protein